MKNIKQITIIGMGLIGGSIALGLKKGGYMGKIVGNDISQSSLEEALLLEAADFVTLDPTEAVMDSDMVVIALPLGSYRDILAIIAPHLKQDAIVTDVGSVKGYVSETVNSALSYGIQFIGGHPMAGSEKGGIQAASGILFENAYYFITPEKNTTTYTIETMESFIRTLRAYPVIITATEHDKIVAQISHLPHLLAVLLVNMLDSNNGVSFLPFAGGGFRDSTRIAAGSPNIWKDIFLFNRQQLIEGINGFQNILCEYKELLILQDEETLFKELSKAKLLRNSLPQHTTNYMPPLYEIVIGIEDKPGAIGDLTGLIGVNNLNIKEIEILHSREEETGALRIGFEGAEEADKAIKILEENHYRINYKRGEKEYVNCE